ncbi:MAG: patatin-like phospholipase family protein [Woeseia sp.]
MIVRHPLSTAAIALLLLVFQVTPFTRASAQVLQQAEPAERPRIGLVLGGGGARGAAHIGVLRELERLRVPVDAIAGTSMGAIIGGLYASGMTPDELEELVKSLDWFDAFQDTSRREDLTYRRKQDDVDFPVNFEMGVSEGRLQLPRGLIHGQKLGLILRELTLDTAHIADFDALPTPFRAVASNLETGESKVISGGDLTLAMRASMSAPGIFAPVVLDGETLVDGGLVGNVPVRAIKAMNVDVIIAVDVEFPLYRGDEIQSALDITAQMLTILIRKETQRQLAELSESDILIRPDLGEFGSTNFAGIIEAIEPGAVATANLAHRLTELSLDAESYRAYVASRATYIHHTDIEVDFVRIRDEGPLSERVLQTRLTTKAGEVVSTETLADDTTRLYGLDLYEQVSYRIVQDGTETGVEFITVPKSWGPNILQFGLSIEGDFEGSTAFNLSTRLTRAGMNALGAEWRTDAQIGTEPYLVSEFYQPLSFDSRYFIAPRISLEQTNFNTFSGDSNVARYRQSEGELAVDVGRELDHWGEFRVGAFRGVGTSRIMVGDPNLPNIDFQTGGITAGFGIDTLDNGQIPLHGTRIQSTVTLSRPGFGADSSFDIVEASATKAWTIQRHTLQAGLEFATTLKVDDLIQNFFPLGGFLRLSGLETGEISGPHAGLARLVYYRRSGETGGGAFDVPLYLGASVEAGNAWQSRSDISVDSLLMNGSLFAGLDTWFGPLYLAAGFAEGGSRSFYLFLGTPPR